MQKASIVAVGMDRSGTYRVAVEEHLPKADIVFDKFRRISNYGEVIDKIRRRTQAQADTTGRTFIKGQRYNLLRNPEKQSASGRQQLNLLLALRLPTSLGTDIVREGCAPTARFNPSLGQRPRKFIIHGMSPVGATESE